jgi:hypothetical protein
MLSGSIIVNGEFDKYLLRPINPLFHLISEVFQPDAFGELIVGIALVIYASLSTSTSAMGVVGSPDLHCRSSPGEHHLYQHQTLLCQLSPSG